MKIEVGPVWVDLDPIGSERICRHVARDPTGGFEPASLDAWSRMATHGTVLDIGAYSGLYAIAAAKLGAERVIAFEPMPQMFERLRLNAERNGVDIEMLPQAASDTETTAKLWFSPWVPLTSGASLAGALSANADCIWVPTIRIDSLDLNGVTAVKIDVERHEAAVLRGMRDTIARCRPRMLIEVLSDDARAAVLALLPGYRVAATLDTRNLLMEPE